MRASTPVLAVLLLGALLLGPSSTASAAEPVTKGLRYPSLTPDGKQVVFSYRGDIWIAPTEGGAASGSHARRLTMHEAQDTLPRVSPDGTKVAFASQRNGAYDLFVVDLAGGEPRQVTSHSGPEMLCDWSPDGKRLLFGSFRDLGDHGMDLYEVDVSGGTPRRLTYDGGRDGAYSPDGKQVVYSRGFNTIYQDNYEGSANYDLYVVDVAGGLPRRLTDSPRNERWPFFSGDGRSIWFVAEEKGTGNFWVIPVAADPTASGPAPSAAAPRRVSGFEGDDVHRPDLAWDGRTAVFERGGQLFTLDLAAATAGKAEARAVPLAVRSDVRHSGIERRTITGGAEQVSLSPDGTQVAFSVNGDLWTMPAAGGEGTRLTTGGGNEQWPRWSPDGTQIAYQSDAKGNSDIYVMDAKTKATRQLTRHAADDFFHTWSPDGKRLVFCSERSGNRDLWSLEIETGQETQLTTDPAADDDPAFSPDGRWIAFDSAREGPQAVYVMPAAGGAARRVSEGTGYYQVPSFSPDGSLLVYEQYNPAGGNSLGLYVTSVNGGPAVQISLDGQAATWSPRGDWIYFHAERDGDKQIVRVRAPQSIEVGERVPFLGRVDVDLRRELADLFDEAWERMREGFYDPRMHGVDWDKMKAKYRDMAVDTENKEDFYVVFSQMLAELNASHLGIGPGRRDPRPGGRAPESGYLGLDLSDPAADGSRRVLSVLPRGPADGAGLRTGDVVTRISGKALSAGANLDALLAGTVGKEVAVAFRPITDQGLGEERTARLTPVDAGRVHAIRYEEQVRVAAERVKEGSKGRVAYLHLSQMDPPNLQKFQRAVSRWSEDRNIKGMVLDVRDNGGGNIHQQLMDVLQARPYIELQPRGIPQRIKQPAVYWDKPVVVLINERSFSDAEVFPWCFQTAKRGRVVGVPTPGGVIGTNDITLSDGSIFRIPRVGWWGIDGTKLEGRGVQPDILVVESPEDRRKGRDPQLAKALEVVLAEIEARQKPPVKPVEPAPPAPTAPKPTVPQPTVPQPTTPAAPETPAAGKAEPPRSSPPPAAAAEAGPLTPLADCRVGEWVRYRFALEGVGLEGAPTDAVVKFTVAEVRDGRIRLDRVVEEGGGMLPPIPLDLPQGPILERLGEMGKVTHHALVTGEVKGTSVPMLVAHVDMGGIPVEVTVANVVPGLGIFRVSWNKKLVLEALEWGEGDAESAPPTAPTASVPPAPAAPAAPTAPSPAPQTPTPPAAPAAPAAPSEEPQSPLRDAEVGEWIRFKNRIQGQDTIVLQRVVEVTDEEVVLETLVRHGDTVMPASSMRRPRAALLGGRRGSGERTVERTTRTVGGRELPCLLVTSQGRRGNVMREWYSDEVAATGLVRRERDGELVSEVIDWGGPGSAPSEP